MIEKLKSCESRRYVVTTWRRGGSPRRWRWVFFWLPDPDSGSWLGVQTPSREFDLVRKPSLRGSYAFGMCCMGYLAHVYGGHKYVEWKVELDKNV